jgi:hypothetical protein
LIEPCLSCPIAPEELASIYEIGFSQAVVHNDNLMRRMDDIRAGSNGYCEPTVEIPRTIAKDHNPPIQDKNVVIPEKNVTPAFVPRPETRWGVFVMGTGDFVNVGNEDDNYLKKQRVPPDVAESTRILQGHLTEIEKENAYVAQTRALPPRSIRQVDETAHT